MISPLTLTESQIFIALENVLNTFGLASSSDCAVQIIKGQVNRVPEPIGPDYVVMWPLLRQRLAMNIDDYFDNQFTGSITGATLIVTALTIGAVTPGLALYGANVPAGCSVAAQLNGLPGGAGTYRVTASANTGSQTFYNGVKSALQEVEFTIQLDVHGPSSGDNADRIQTLMRDQFAVDAFQALPGGISPLFTDDPRQMPFVNAEQAYEDRWTVDVHLQINPAVLVTQQFAAALSAQATDARTL